MAERPAMSSLPRHTRRGRIFLVVPNTVQGLVGSADVRTRGSRVGDVVVWGLLPSWGNTHSEARACLCSWYPKMEAGLVGVAVAMVEEVKEARRHGK